MTTTSKKDIYGATDVSLHNSTKWPQTNGGSPTKSDGDNNTTGVMGFPGKRFCPDGICDEKDAKKFSHYHHYSNGKHKHNHPINPRVYFTEFTARKAFLYGIASVYVIGCGLASVAAVFLDLPCPTTAATTIEFPNPAYDGSRCPHVRHAILLGLTTTECSFGRRLVMSILMGGLIGWERRQADRPAGIRTMSLVSLGSCLFTINSTFAFLNGPMAWDASRISAAIPSGVGFLGAGLIFKKTNDDDNMVVHGLTTAASVWLSAAVGIACGGELYFAASFGTCLMMLLLRFGPRGSDTYDDEDTQEEEDTETEDEDKDDGYENDADDDMHGDGEDGFRGNGGRGVPKTVSRIEIVSGGSVVAAGTEDFSNHGDANGIVAAGNAGTATQATLVFRNSEGGWTSARQQQQGHDGRSLRSLRSNDGSYTVTGESIENNSLAAETTPMLLPQVEPPRAQQQQQQSTPQQSQQQQRMQQQSTQVQRQQQRQKPLKHSSSNKSFRNRKRHSHANLGSIV